MDGEVCLDVVHYICSRCNPSELGNVKLHKILYFSDMLHFTATGRPLTGVEYQKQRFGPCARHLTRAIAELREQGRLNVHPREFYGFTKMDYIAVGAPRLDRLGNEIVLPLLNEVIDFVCSRSAKEISELSHNAAWDSVGYGDRIAYFTAFWMQIPELTEDHVTAAEERIARLPEFA